jgi:phospholipid/cholesterol/gamma-HCH transport system substrate-binding protein
MKELKTGMMVFIALIMFVFAILFVGDFKETVFFRIKFEKVLGLKVEAPVLLNGVEVGRVTKIYFSGNSKDNLIYVDISVEKSAAMRINESTKADIQTMGVLGDKFISLETSILTAKPLKEEAFISVKETLDYKGMIAQGQGILDNVAEITASLNKLSNSVKNGRGMLGTLINNPELGESLIESISIVTNNLKEGTGFLGKLINDKEFCVKMTDSLDTILFDLQTAMESLNNQNSLAGTFLHDKEFSKKVTSDLQTALQGFAIIGRKLAETKDNAIVGVLLKDEEAGKNLKKALKHLSSILEKIDNGEGTLGKMVNDSSLYDNADLVFKGAKNSKLTKRIINHYKKKGLEADK